MRQKQYDIFISYSSKDSHIAFMLCEALENKGLICWIAPRDVEAGHYADSIVEGVESSKLFVLLFSQNSNDSRPVLNELEMAMASKLLIIPARIEEVLPSKAMKFYLMTTHWFDIFEPKSVKDFHKFVSMVKGNLGESNKVSIENVEPQKMEIIWLEAEAEAEKKKNILSFKNILISISVLIVILALSYILIEEKTQNAVISPVKLKAPTPTTDLIDINKSIKNKDLTKKLIKETKEKEHWKEEYFKLREKYKKYSTLIVQAEEIKKTKGYEEAVNFYMNIKESNYRAAVNQYILPKNIENAIDYDYTGNASIIESNTNPKKALLIANYNYKKSSSLQDPSNSLNKLKRTLEALGFDVTIKKNLNINKMRKAIEYFSEELSKDANSIGLVYYSGHGYQSDNESYLAPIDINFRYNRSQEVAYTSFNIKEMLRQLSYAQNKLNIYFLDTFLNTEEYIPAIPSDTLVMYAFNGEVAKDNNNFIDSITKQIKKPVNISEITNNIRIEVTQNTGNEQRPIVISNYIPPVFLKDKINPTISKIFNLKNKNKLSIIIKSEVSNQKERAFCKGEIITVEVENIREIPYLISLALDNRGELILIQPDGIAGIYSSIIIKAKVMPPFGIDNLKVFGLKNKSQFDKIVAISKQSPHGLLTNSMIDKLYEILISDKNFREQEASILTMDEDISVCQQ